MSSGIDMSTQTIGNYCWTWKDAGHCSHVSAASGAGVERNGRNSGELMAWQCQKGKQEATFSRMYIEKLSIRIVIPNNQHLQSCM